MSNTNLAALADDDADQYTEPSPMILKLRREKCQHLRDLVEDLLVTDHLREWTTDAQIVRFLKATGWDLSKSKQRLRDTLAWRAGKVACRPGSMCSLCERNPHAHNLYHCGYDKAGCPVIYSSFGRAHERGNGDGNVEHLISTLDRLIKVMPVDVPGYLWVCDFEGFGFSDCNLAMIMQCVEIFGKHYPETLAGIYVVGAPRLWDLFWPTLNAAIRMSFASVAKVHFVKAPDGSGAGEHFRPVFMQLFDEELVLWMLEEMNENRDSSVSGKKLGWLEAVRADNGVTRNGSKHDLRGPLSFRKSAAAKVCWGLAASLDEAEGRAPEQPRGPGGDAGGDTAATAEERKGEASSGKRSENGEAAEEAAAAAEGSGGGAEEAPRGEKGEAPAAAAPPAEEEAPPAASAEEGGSAGGKPEKGKRRKGKGSGAGKANGAAPAAGAVGED